MSTDNPQYQLRWSDDGGNRWSNWRVIPAGRIGEVNRLMRIYRLGFARNRVYELTFQENVPSAIFGASIDVKATRS